LPGTGQSLEIEGELAWEGSEKQAGVRFKDASDEQRKMISQWLSSRLTEPEQDDPPVICKVTDQSLGGCYLTTGTPFPRGTRVTLSIKTADLEVHAKGSVLVTHPEFGMGVEFLQKTDEQRAQAQRLVTALRAKGDSPELRVVPDGLDRSSPGDHPVAGETPKPSGTEDALVDLFRQKFQVPVENFMEQMRKRPQSGEPRSLSAKQ